MYTSDLAPVAEIRGTFGVDRAAKRVDCANKFPEYTCARYFENHLRRKGISCSSGAADYKLMTEWMAESMSDPELTIIGSTLSPSLDRIVFETNHASNNVFAETLFRTLGKVLTGSACYDSSYVALDAALAELNVSTSRGFRIQDGSGLSRQNLLSPEALCRFLYAMGDSPAFSYFMESLPSPGFSGTLEYNMKGQPAALRNRIKVKSGSMNGVRCYSGYILPSVQASATESGIPEGTLIVSIMTNNCTSPSWKVRPLLDRLMVALAKNN
jgi:D-alanyl-D-alanine carboxypeptidase/D-alanyl-D-alanine-endopeptidase (penicillin-binding protein 4)